jgi:hypothetical protein
MQSITSNDWSRYPRLNRRAHRQPFSVGVRNLLPAYQHAVFPTLTLMNSTDCSDLRWKARCLRLLLFDMYLNGFTFALLFFKTLFVSPSQERDWCVFSAVSLSLSSAIAATTGLTIWPV